MDTDILEQEINISDTFNNDSILEQEIVLPEDDTYPVNMDMIKEWYSDVILYEIVKQTYRKEVAFLRKNNYVRNVKAFTVLYLIQNMKAMGFYRKVHNMYYSVAYFNNLPTFSFNFITRKLQQQKFRTDYIKYLSGMDIAIDFDAHEGKNIKEAYDEFKYVHDLFSKQKVPFSPRFSGSGFHIVIPFEDFPEGIAWREFPEEFLKEIRRFLNLPSLDTSTGSHRSLLKIPYTLDIKTGNVCLPLHPKQVDSFNIKDMSMKHNLSVPMRNRGIMKRSGNKETFKRFIGDYLW